MMEHGACYFDLLQSRASPHMDRSPLQGQALTSSCQCLPARRQPLLSAICLDLVGANLRDFVAGGQLRQELLRNKRPRRLLAGVRGGDATRAGACRWTFAASVDELRAEAGAISHILGLCEADGESRGEDEAPRFDADHVVDPFVFVTLVSPPLTSAVMTVVPASSMLHELPMS